MLNSNSAAKKKPVFENSSSLRVVSKNDTGKSKSPKWLLWALLLIGSGFLIHHYYMEEQELPPGIIVTPEGDLALSPERKAKLDKVLDEIDNAVQYALFAVIDGSYPCYSCVSGQKKTYFYTKVLSGNMV